MDPFIKNSWRSILEAKLGVLEEELDFMSLFNDSFVITDPELPDNPIVYASETFITHTGYLYDDIVGKNCRFLQGTDTKPEQVQKIRDLIRKEEQGTVHITNYTKDGTMFSNIFLLVPIKKQGKAVFFLGAQGFRILVDNPKSTFERLANFLFPEKIETSLITVVSNGVSARANELPITINSEYVTGVSYLKTKQHSLQSKFVKFFEESFDLFDLQIQFLLKKEIPEDYEVFIGAEIRSQLSMGLGVKVLAASALSVIKMFSPELHISYGNSENSEFSHICFPFHILPDSLILTSETEVAPSLSTERLPTVRHSKEVPMIKNCTYTLSVCNSMLHLEKWEVHHLPGVKSVDLKKFWFDNPIHVVAYAVPRGSIQHLVSSRVELFDIEIRHDSLGSGQRHIYDKCDYLL